MLLQLMASGREVSMWKKELVTGGEVAGSLEKNLLSKKLINFCKTDSSLERTNPVSLERH